MILTKTYKVAMREYEWITDVLVAIMVQMHARKADDMVKIEWSGPDDQRT